MKKPSVGAKPIIRRAVAADADALTAIAFASKRFWGYPEAYMTLWRDSLTVSARTIARYAVYLSSDERGAHGFYSLSCPAGEEKAVLEALFIAPPWIGRGVGSALLDHAVAAARARRASWLEIASDPNALGFYLRRGAKQIGDTPSLPPGRRLPLLSLALRQTQEPIKHSIH